MEKFLKKARNQASSDPRDSARTKVSLGRKDSAKYLQGSPTYTSQWRAYAAEELGQHMEHYGEQNGSEYENWGYLAEQWGEVDPNEWWNGEYGENPQAYAAHTPDNQENEEHASDEDVATALNVLESCDSDAYPVAAAEAIQLQLAANVVMGKAGKGKSQGKGKKFQWSNRT